jgi:hypothetical protein
MFKMLTRRLVVHREEPRFQVPFQLLTSLMDIDTLMTKWRCEFTPSEEEPLNTLVFLL